MTNGLKAYYNGWSYGSESHTWYDITGNGHHANVLGILNESITPAGEKYYTGTKENTVGYAGIIWPDDLLNINYTLVFGIFELTNPHFFLKMVSNVVVILLMFDEL